MSAHWASSPDSTPLFQEIPATPGEEDAHAAEVLDLLRQDALRCYDHYLDLLNEDDDGRPLREGQDVVAVIKSTEVMLFR